MSNSDQTEINALLITFSAATLLFVSTCRSEAVSEQDSREVPSSAYSEFASDSPHHEQDLP